MLSLEIDDLEREIADAIALRDKHLAMWRKILQRYISNYWSEELKLGKATPENYIHAYLSFVLPQLVFENPAVTVSATKVVSDKPVAEALELAIGHWIKEIGYKQQLQDLARNMILGWGVTKVGLAPRGHYAGGGLPAVEGDFELRSLWPYVKVLENGQFFIDAHCTHSRNARLMGHEFERDIDDLKGDERYDQAVIAELVPHDGPTKRPDDVLDGHRPQPGANRKVVCLYELYLPEHGKILTLAKGSREGKAQVIRDEQYYGPDEGPYQLWGMYVVPGQVYPLSPIAAVFEQFEELQSHAERTAEDAAAFKRMAGVEAGAANDAKIVKNAKNGDTLILQGLGNVKEITVGGVDDKQFSYVEILRERLDRTMGYTDAQRGKAGSETATAVSVASQNSDLRLDFMRQKVRDHATVDLRKVAWFFFYEETITTIVTQTDPRTGAQSEKMFWGGVWEGGWVGGVYIPPQTDIDFVDFAFDIDPLSMIKVDNALQQKRAQDAFTLMMQLVGAGVLPPQLVNWRQLLDWYGDSINTRNFSKIVLLDELGLYLPLNPLNAMNAGQMISANQPGRGGLGQMGAGAMGGMGSGGMGEMMPRPQQLGPGMAGGMPGLIQNARGQGLATSAA